MLSLGRLQPPSWVHICSHICLPREGAGRMRAGIAEAQGPHELREHRLSSMSPGLRLPWHLLWMRGRPAGVGWWGQWMPPPWTAWLLEGDPLEQGPLAPGKGCLK